MPRMPTAEDLGQTNLQSRNVVQGPRDNIGASVAGFGSTVQRAGIAAEKQARDEAETLDLVRATSDWNTRILKERSQYSYDLDQKYPTWGKRFDAAAPKHADAAASLIRDPALRQKFRIQADDDILRHSLSVHDAAREIDRDRITAEAFNGLDANLAAATLPGVDQESANKVIRDTSAAITAMERNGTITPEAAIKARAESLRKYTNILAMRNIETDPEAAARHLAGAGNEVYIAKLERMESSGSDTARADKSTAAGRFQFIDSTWAEVMKNHPELNLSVDGRTDRYQAGRAVRAFTQDNAEALRMAQMPVTEKTLYLAHFLGSDGAIRALSAPPGTKASKMFPKAALANPEVFRDRTIGEVIANQTAGFSDDAGPAPAYYEFLDPTDRLQLTAAAEAESARRVKEARERNSVEMFHVKRAVDNDVAQMEATGVGTDLTAQQVADTLGEDDAARWVEKRVQAAETYAAVSVIDSMTDDQIEVHLRSLTPREGDNYARDQAVYDRAEDRADAVRTLRDKDPAAAVEDSPLVREAKQNYNPANPQSVQQLVAARLAAQGAVDIHPTLQNPITKREARQIIAPIGRIIDNMDAAILAATIEGKGDRSARRAAGRAVKAEAEAEAKKLIDAIETTYGPYADQVFTFAVGEYVNDRTVGEVISATLRKAAKGIRPSTSDAQSADAAIETSTAEKAMSGDLPTPQPTSPVPRTATAKSTTTPKSTATGGVGGRGAATGKPAASGAPVPTRGAVEALMKFPHHASHFDAIYGPGAANEALGKYSRR